MKRIVITTIERNEKEEITATKKFYYDQRENIRTLESELAFQRALATLHAEVFPDAEEYSPNKIFSWLLNCNGDPRYMRVAINTTYIPVGESPLLYDLISECEIEREDAGEIIAGANFFSQLMQHLTVQVKRGESESGLQKPLSTRQPKRRKKEIS